MTNPSPTSPPQAVTPPPTDEKLELTPAAARDLIDGLQRLANCEAIADYEPGYINKEFAARQKVARGMLERNMARLTRIAARLPSKKEQEK